MPKSRKANFRSKRAQTKKRGKRMGRKRMGRRLQKGGIHGFHDGDISSFERGMEKFMVEQLEIRKDSMDWWDITCIDLRKNMKYIYEYHELKKKNKGNFSEFWLNDYKKKLLNLNPFDLTAQLGDKTDMNTCGYTQKCIQTTDDKLRDLNRVINSALAEIKSELKNKTAEPDSVMTVEEEKIQAEGIKLLAEIKFCISIKEWIKIRAKAKPTNKNSESRCNEYTTIMNKYIEFIKNRYFDLYRKFTKLQNDYRGVKTDCKILDDTIYLLELKNIDLNHWGKNTDDELSDKLSILSNVKKACEEINSNIYAHLDINRYPTGQSSTAYNVLDKYNRAPVENINEYNTPIGYTEIDDDEEGEYSAASVPGSYIESMPNEGIYVELGRNEDEDGGGRKSKKKTRSKFRRGKKRLTRK